MSINTNNRILDSHGLKYSFNDYELSENHRPIKTNYVQLPQKRAVIEDTLSGEQKVVNVPNLEMETLCKYREK